MNSSTSVDFKLAALQLSNGELRPCETKERIKRLLLPHHDQREIQIIANHIFDQLKDRKTEYAPIANRFIQQYARTRNGSKISQILDRTLVQHQFQSSFQHPANQTGYQKWQLYGQSASLYEKHPEFCHFAEQSGLLSQIKITRESFTEIDGEPALKVNGSWMKWSVFQQQFQSVFSQTYQENFIVHTASRTVYTYLDNGQGLQPHHPFLSEKSPISRLNEDEYTKLLEQARSFVRTEESNLTQAEKESRNQARTFVLQLVTSYTKGPETRFTELVVKAKHPYIRLIIGQDNQELNTKKGEVYEVGYGWKNKLNIPLTTTQGRFRSPDIWEYKGCEERVITSFAVTPEEAKAFADYVTEYHRTAVLIGNPIGFHLFKQNCSTFVRAALGIAHIQVPTEIKLSDLWEEVIPVWFQQLKSAYRGLKEKAIALSRHCIRILPQSIKDPILTGTAKIQQVYLKAVEGLSALAFLPVKVALGDASGTGGIAFTLPGQKPESIEPNLKSFRRWFMLSSYTCNLPGILQRWQREQASTFIHRNPIRLRFQQDQLMQKNSLWV